MLEKTIEMKVCNYAQSKGWVVYKFTSPSRRSVPDRMLITPKGVVVFIEFKRLGKVPTIAQGREIKRLLTQKCNVFVVDNIVRGKQLIDNINEGNKSVGLC